MKSLILFAIVLFCIAIQAKSAELSVEDMNNIKASSKKWVETYNQNDWKGLAELFTSKATMMPPNSVAIIGRKDIASWQEKNESGFRIAFDIQEISGSDHIAYVRGRSCLSIPDGKGGFGIDVGKFLEIRKKQENGAWLIYADIFNSDAPLGSELLDKCPFETAQ